MSSVAFVTRTASAAVQPCETFGIVDFHVATPDTIIHLVSLLLKPAVRISTRGNHFDPTLPLKVNEYLALLGCWPPPHVWFNADRLAPPAARSQGCNTRFESFTKLIRGETNRQQSGAVCVPTQQWQQWGGKVDMKAVP